MRWRGCSRFLSLLGAHTLDVTAIGEPLLRRRLSEEAEPRRKGI
jgi:hypothetical protein